jgi:hypothetical protein
MKEVLATVLLLTISLVSFGKTDTSPLQTESSSMGFTPEISVITLIFPTSNANKYLNTREVSNKKLVRVVESRKKCLKDNASLTEKRDNHSKISATTNMSGKQVKYLFSKKMANLLRAVSVEEFSVLRIKTDTISGTKDITTPFVSYYPGLLNEKIL